MKLSAIASALKLRLENASPDIEITGLNGIEQAGPGELTFVANPKYAAAARPPRLQLLLLPKTFPPFRQAMLRAEDPYLAFAQRARALPSVRCAMLRESIATAVVHPTAKIGRDAHIGPYVVVDENVEIGDECRAAGACGDLSRSDDRR